MLTRRRIALIAGVLLAALASPALLAAGLRVGVAKSVITPYVKSGKVFMAGFGNDRVATGVHDDLYVRCLALAAADRTVVMCSADLIGLFYDDVRKIRGEVQARAPEVTHLIVASTHDHEGPDTMGLWGATPFESGIDEKYMEGLRERIATTAVEAVRSMQPARLTLGRSDNPLLGLLQADSRPPYVKDPYLFVMRFVSAANAQPIATLINWSDHPETLGGQNTEITADYPHWLCRYVEEHLGGTAIFFDGSIGGLLSTLGDAVALQDPSTGQLAKDDTWLKAELFGKTLGILVERAVKHPEEAEVDSIMIRKKVFFAPMQNDRFRAAGAAGIFKGRKPLYTNGEIDANTAEKEFPGLGKLKYFTGKDLRSEVDYLALVSRGRIVAEICTVPGEIYPELVNGGITRYAGADFPNARFEPTIRAHLKSRYQFIFGLGNDEIGYIIPKAEWDDQPPWLQHRKERCYGEINSAGPDMAGAVTHALAGLIDQK
jgi:hypothetical protein